MFSISCSVLPDLCCVNLPARFLIFLSTSCLNIAEKCWYFKGLPLDLFTSISRARVCWKVWQSCLQHLLNLHHDYHSQLLVLKDLDCYSAPFFQWFRLWLFVFFLILLRQVLEVSSIFHLFIFEVSSIFMPLNLKVLSFLW